MEGGRGASISSTVEAAADGHPGHVPTFNREVGQALVKMLVQVGVVQAGSATCNGGLPSIRCGGAEEIDGQTSAHGLGELGAVAIRQGQEGHGDAAGWSCAGSKPESGSRASVGSPIDTASPTVKCGGDGSVAVFRAEGEAKGDGDLGSGEQGLVRP